MSIITVSLNSVKDIAHTIKSVLNQTYENIEFIIIDGGSTDGTIDVIRSYNDRLAYWLSEPDRGIYHAMNKGIMQASGDWINFMNAGDIFYQPYTVESVLQSGHEKADIFYGNNEIVYSGNFSVIRKAMDIEDIWKGMIVNHQSLFVRSDLLRKHPFDLSFKIGADYEFIYSVYMDKCNFIKIDSVISCTAHGGFSDMNVIANIKEQWIIAGRYSTSYKVHLHYVWLILFALLKNILKKLLPAKVQKIFIRWKYQ